ncbi:fused FliR family export protein/FlhB family type III secretion system protein [Candidatus Clostridium stratigraminis]|uniref:Flagellar biosynthetic protein FliR n=1 Tax=Candidatus Clostridium stratigraminis TaxID=3381661 RepID=A0ABW8T381_9CLOT
MIDIAYFTTLILIFVRMLTFFIVVPIFFPKGTPNAAKIALSLVTAYVLMPGIDYKTLSVASNYSLVAAVFCEIIIGLTLGYITNLCFYSIKMAGNIIDLQIGFSMVNTFDPNSNSNVTLVEQAMYWSSVILFFSIDGHHMLIKALIESFNSISLGKFILSEASFNLIFTAFIQFFIIGFKIAVPIVLIVIIVDITLGLIGRTVPQLNVMILGLPIKILMGLLSLVVILPLIMNLFVLNFDNTQQAIKGLFKIIPCIIIFASEDKTEEATPKKKSEARKKGQVARSKEVNLALTLVASTLILVILGAYVGNSLLSTTRMFLGNYLTTNIDYNTVQNLTLVALWRAAIIILPVVIPIMIFGIAANFIQVGFMFTGEPIKMQLSKLNPINGLKRIFSFRTFVETIKDVAIISILSYISYTYIKGNYNTLLNIGNTRIELLPSIFSKIVIGIFFKITIVMIVIAAIDFLYQKYKYNKELRMTKQEIKEEFKQQEGDPQIKSRIKQRQRELASRRMMQAVPNATVVVTNPTHIACALRYEEGKDSAPVLVAKGADNIAIKIKEIAKENKVPIMENRALARLIYSEVEIDSAIPGEMYQAVAEILAAIYKMKKRK